MKFIKFSSIGWLLCAAGVVIGIGPGIILRSAKAEQQSRHRVQVVIIDGYEVYPSDGNYHFVVYGSSSSQNTPRPNRGDDLAETLAYYRSLGFIQKDVTAPMAYHLERETDY